MITHSRHICFPFNRIFFTYCWKSSISLSAPFCSRSFSICSGKFSNQIRLIHGGSFTSRLARRFSVTSSPIMGSEQPFSDAGHSIQVAETLGFTKVSEEFIAECKSTVVLFRHKRTGAEILSLSNNDENKVFGIVFRTLPENSTGIPHILEHSVLCGSRKYPVKEPFVELLKGSLNTFLNAFTYPDRTCYPVASTNTKDFYNLVDVYLDAVFFPKCVEDSHIFQQEGWHFELNNPSEELCYKGVVYNEMKGVYSQPDSILSRVAQQALFPSNVYAVDSGGDPKLIPKLTFQQFKDFHSKFYHPCNSRIWFYGDDNPEERLHLLSGYLNMFRPSTASQESRVVAQQMFSKPIRIVEKYSVGSEHESTKKHIISVNWLLSEKPVDKDTELKLGVLDHLLLGTPASPMKKMLLDSGLGESVVGGGLDDDLLQLQFAIGLKGVSKEDVQKVEDLIMHTLKDLAEEGFKDEAMEASLNTIEFCLRENNTGSYPRGLSLMLQSFKKWMYDLDPCEPLKYERSLRDLKSQIAAEGSKAIFSPLITKFLLNNFHRVTVELQPDSEKASFDEATERKNLTELKSNMNEQEIRDLVHSTAELKLMQETPNSPEALKCIPCLALSDISKDPVRIPLEVVDCGSGKVLQHDLFTNGIIYTEVVFNMGILEEELLPLVPLFCQSLLEMGTRQLTFVQLNQLIGRKTGGISIYPYTSSKRGHAEPCSYIIVRGKAMADHTDDLLSLMNMVLQEVQFTDQHRFKQFVLQSKSELENHLRGSGHSIAATRMNAKLSTAGWILEQMGGISYLTFLDELGRKVDENWAEVTSSLDKIRAHVFSRSNCLINMTAEAKHLAESESHARKFLGSFPAHTSEVMHYHNRLSRQCEAITVPTKVNYVGKAVSMYDCGYKLHGSVHVITKCINTTWLWDRIRVSGGAYGGFCDFDSHSGIFTFLSYRDPNLLKTLDIYDETTNFLRSLEMDHDTLTKMIIGTIGDMDSYQLPDAKGYSSMLRYLLGVSEEERKQRREEILSTSLEDFKKFAEVIEAVKREGVVVAVTSPEAVEAANKDRPNFFDVKRVL